jgi:hypothetical protein
MRPKPSHTLINPFAEISYRLIDIPRNEQNAPDGVAVQQRREEKQLAAITPVTN